MASEASSNGATPSPSSTTPSTTSSNDKPTSLVDPAMGLVLDEDELEIATKVMVQLAAHPELAHFSFLPPDSKGRKLRRALRIAALKWLKPGPADNIRDIQASGRDSDKQLIAQSGIRWARNQRKRALPAQHGHIMLDESVPHTPQLMAPLSDTVPAIQPKTRGQPNVAAAATAASPAITTEPTPTTTPTDVTSPAATTAPSTPSVSTTSTTTTTNTTSSSTPPVVDAMAAAAAAASASLPPTMIGHGRPRTRKEPAQGHVKVKRGEIDDEKAARDAERKAKRDAVNSVGIDVHEIKRATQKPHKRGDVVIDDADDLFDDQPSSSPSSSSNARETKGTSPSSASFNGAPEDLPASTVPRDPTEEIGDSKEPAYGRGPKRREKVYLRTPIPCYICKKHYTLLHHFYDRMCPPCAELNYEKRFQTADLTLPPLPVDPSSTSITPAPVRRRIALVTGGRIKIGFDVVLMLVRAGAFVIVTSRFPKDTAHRLALEKDYNEWRDRIHIYGLDLRVLADVEAFCEHVLATYPRLDILINNAAQTIRRPPQYYQHMMTMERTPIAALAAPLAATLHEFREPAQLRLMADADSKTHDKLLTADSSTNGHGNGHGSHGHDGGDGHEHKGASKALMDAKEADIRLAPTSAVALRSAAGLSSAELSQVPLLPEDHVKDDVNFPVNCFDLDGQQIDKRPSQTWVKQLHEVSTVELAEVHIVNALAPFILNSKLKPLMMQSKEGAFIINVSSMEGKFRAFKDVTHPHTNMAKAALNMMTHTVAKDLAHDRIFINSVDTGWVTEELPFPIAQQKKREGFEPPLDEIDGAARILDPIWRSIRDGIHDFGMFFKDYRPADW